MRIQVLGQMVEVTRGQVACADPDVQSLLADAVSEEGFFAGTYFRSHEASDNFIGEQLAAQFGGQVIALNSLDAADPPSRSVA